MYESQDFLAASDYFLAWSIYGVSALVLLFLFWYVIRGWQRDLRWLLLGLAAVLLLLPSSVPGHSALAPALAFLTLGIVSGHGAEVLAPVAVKLTLAATVVVAVVVATAMLRRRSALEAQRRAELARRRSA